MNGEDPFSALGLEARFDLDPAQIDAAWLKRVRASHPDRGLGREAADPLSAVEAEERTSRLNQAREALRDPLRRGSALLKRRGVEEAEGERRPPPELLVTMLEFRERLEDALVEQDAAALEAIRAETAAACEASLAELTALFAASAPESALQAELDALRYLERWRQELRSRLQTGP